MALFKVLRGQQSALDGIAKVDGHAYFCWDDGTFWIDYKESDSTTEVKRKQINKENWTKDIADAMDAFTSAYEKADATLKTELEGLITGAVNYLGAVSSFDDLANFSTATAGDFCRVSTEFTFGTEMAHVGDMLIALQDAPIDNVLHWDLIHNEYDWTHTHTVITEGTVSKPNFTGTKATISTEYTPSGSVSKPNFTGDEGTATAIYTPAGTINKPNVTVTPETTNVYSITDVGSLPAISTTYTESTQTVKIGFNTGSLPTKGSAQAVMTSVTAALAAAPTFSGTEATIKSNYTPVGSVSQPTFSGTQATISADYTPVGSISQPTFTGTAVETSEPTA